MRTEPDKISWRTDELNLLELHLVHLLRASEGSDTEALAHLLYCRAHQPKPDLNQFYTQYTLSEVAAMLGYAFEALARGRTDREKPIEEVNTLINKMWGPDNG